MTRRLATFLACCLALVGAATVTGAVAWGHPTDTTDTDHDGRGPTPANPGGTDNCPDAHNTDQVDTDGDARPSTGPAGTPGTPTDTGGDACDTDDDGDRVDDALDNCRLVGNPTQTDTDGDGEGDLCDTDDDADGVSDLKDNCIKVPNADQGDRDDDFVGDACDPDPGARSPRDPAASAAPARPVAPAAPAGGANGAATTTPPAPDTSAPRLLVSVARSFRLDELGGGLAVPVSVSEQSVVAAQLRLDGKTVRRLSLSKQRRTMAIAKGSTDVAEPGRTFVFVRFSKPTLARLARARRGRIRPTLEVTARDPGGNLVTVTRRLSLAR